MAAEFQSALLNTLIRELNAAMHSHLPDVPRNAKHHATAVSHLRSLQPIIHGLVDEAVATVGRRVNQFAAVNRLNEDTLVLIFAELLDITSRANVAWVCQRWRRAVCATPTLWNHVDLWAGHPGFRAIVQQSCERSAHLPIDVKFSFSEPVYPGQYDDKRRPAFLRGCAREQLEYLRNALHEEPTAVFRTGIQRILMVNFAQYMQLKYSIIYLCSIWEVYHEYIGPETELAHSAE
ncbi:hypothetical protein BKA62DRAFT_773371 [Auriculariales sp. MPI-PUGE-AT-0066]|nr:hypothetical protein BKA62DRAFT_773371 [Auriculariales sp. MPI-PUGE-AT-0066]